MDTLWNSGIVLNSLSILINGSLSVFDKKLNPHVWMALVSSVMLFALIAVGPN